MGKPEGQLTTEQEKTVTSSVAETLVNFNNPKLNPNMITNLNTKV
jgi:hypothetical protein